MAMAYYRYEVPGGEYVLQGDHYWQITFNGVQIGGLYRRPEDAVAALDRRRAAQIPGPDLADVPNPPADLQAWHTPHLTA